MRKVGYATIRASNLLPDSYQVKLAVNAGRFCPEHLTTTSPIARSTLSTSRPRQYLSRRLRRVCIISIPRLALFHDFSGYLTDEKPLSDLDRGVRPVNRVRPGYRQPFRRANEVAPLPRSTWRESCLHLRGRPLDRAERRRAGFAAVGPSGTGGFRQVLTRRQADRLHRPVRRR